MPHDDALHKDTVRRIDWFLLPFLALLFLFNSLDKSNIGNAESAHFTSDIGLEKGDLNTAVALFFAFFVTLQPLGAALGRRYGMVLWVPSCMLLWGISTALHVWVRHRWQLYLLRIMIGCLEAGFYPVTVAYLSLFYTRFEFGRRLSLFYGQAAVGGALGGLLSYAVFTMFPGHSEEDHGEDGDQNPNTRWQSWQALFLFEGVLTIIVALIGYFWLPGRVDTAWFFKTPEQRIYASERVKLDRLSQVEHEDSAGENADEEAQGLLESTQADALHNHPPTDQDVTDDHGLTPHDIISACLSAKIWHILVCNILSSIPVYAFQVFLPLVLAPLTDTPDPALVNLLTAPPYVCGAITLYLFASWSDKHRIRIKPILVGLALLLVGLSLVVLLPGSKAWVIPRYIALNILLSGTFIASPLTVAWISGNTPSPGKRTLLLGINGWGNLAGVLSALLFKPKYAKTGYIIPFWWTLGCVGIAAAGYVLFLRNLQAENRKRKELLLSWEEEDREVERMSGQGPLPTDYRLVRWLLPISKRFSGLQSVSNWLEEAAEGGREGDEKMTFVYGL
ncbi:MFS general substrate transporter [Polyplosphaeria fusca]|uniref:MFS general substrate transporter n=1 Tax=Polyplosphaeria fusca TaxID=682080 RepID=A0A9P4R820_9PLEO|nr:MFS general substrate transporter [Polyplosphaeria fusca]